MLCALDGKVVKVLEVLYDQALVPI